MTSFTKGRGSLRRDNSSFQIVVTQQNRKTFLWYLGRKGSRTEYWKNESRMTQPIMKVIFHSVENQSSTFAHIYGWVEKNVLNYEFEPSSKILLDDGRGAQERSYDFNFEFLKCDFLIFKVSLTHDLG